MAKRGRKSFDRRKLQEAVTRALLTSANVAAFRRVFGKRKVSDGTTR